MGTVTRPLPPNWIDLDSSKLHQHLRDKGIDIDNGGVSITDGNLVVEAPANTEAEIEAAGSDFTVSGQATLDRLAADIAAGKPIIRAAMQKPIASRTNNELALAAFGAYLWREELLS